MIIWIDGAYGVGKTAVATKLKERFSDDKAELLESDYYCNESLKYLIGEIKTNKRFPYFLGGTLPQNNMSFIHEFRELIEEKSINTEKNIIVDMALTMKECKEQLFDCLKSEGKNIVNIILTADEGTIKSRIMNDKYRMKETALEWLTHNIAFLEQNFPDAVRIKTNNRDIDDIVAEVIGAISC